MTTLRRLLTIGHSYVVGQNRRLAHELALAGRSRGWEVTVAAPTFVHGDLRPISLEHRPDEPYRLVPLRVRGSKRIHTMFYERGLRKVLQAEPWDLVHVWEEPYILAGYQIARNTPRRTPLVFWTAQNIHKWYPPPFSFFEHSVVKRSSGWLACGHTTVETLLKRPGYSAKPFRILPLGVDLAAFRADEQLAATVRRELDWSDDGPPIVGYLGRFVPEKGVRILMQALDKTSPPWRALFVGGGPLERELRTWSVKHGDRVRILTDVSHDRVPRVLCAMHVLAAPSQTTPKWREQLGRMILEAMACSVPVIGSDSAEIPHVIGDTGIVVPEGDVSRWADALARLLNEEKLRSELADRGLRRVREEYAWPAIADRHWNFFEEVLANDAARTVSS